MIMLIQLIVLLVIIKDISSIGSSKSSSSSNDEGKKWCDYLQKVPEPDVILYNRLAKCGSTTMKMLFDTLSVLNTFVSESVSKIFWKDLDLDIELRKNFLIHVNDIKATTEKLVVDGHWFHTQFSSKELKGATFENIQLLRECKSRKHSKFLYGLYDSASASHAKEINKKELDKFKQEYLRSNMSATACLKSYECIKGTGKFDRSDYEIRSVCGSKCKDDNNGDAVKGAYINTYNPYSYAVIGTLEKMSQYLEMLECAYPTMLNGISKVYQDEQVHGMEGSHNTVYSPAMTKILNESCDPSFNGYVDLYDSLVKLADDRYKYMIENKDSCCRVRK